jgi:6-phosphogluconolactonase (cycloisomerase 2 family)
MTFRTISPWISAASLTLLAGCTTGSAATPVANVEAGPALDAGRSPVLDAGAPDAAAPDATLDATAADAAGGAPQDATLDADGAPDAEGDAAEAADSTDGGAGAGTEVAYIATYLDGVLAFRIDPATGHPDAIDGSPFDPGGHLYGVAIHPSGAFLYTADLDHGALQGYRIGAGGILSPVPNSPLAVDGAPITVAVDPQGRFAYAGNYAAPSIFVERIDADGGALSPVDGSPFVFADGGGPGFAFVVAEPSGRFLYATQFGAPGIRAYAVDGASGALTEIAGSPFGTALVAGKGLSVHPSGRFLFGGGLSAFAIDADSGALSPVTGSPFATVGGSSDPNAIDIATDRRGRYVYEIDTFAGTVSALRVDADAGTLAPVDGSPFDAGFSPYSVAVDPAGKYVYVGNDDIGLFSVFSIDPSNGALSPLQGSPFSPDGLQPQILITTPPP